MLKKKELKSILLSRIMQELEYKIISRGELELKVEDKVMIIHGEIIIDPPSFEVYTKSINKWHSPSGIKVTTEEKNKIINALLIESKKKGNTDLHLID